MKAIRFVCLLTFTLVVAATSMLAQSWDAGSGSSSADREMQRGISVQMAASRTAQSMPAADDLDAWVVTVSDSGDLYFRTDLVTFNELIESMKVHPRKRVQRLYIKADARTQYANVEKALVAARAALFEAPVLLTSQKDSHVTPGKMTPPVGLEVWAGPAAAQDTAKLGTAPTVVEIFLSTGSLPQLKVNGENIPWARLGDVLNRLPASERRVYVQAARELPFLEVVSVLDLCRSAGAAVVLAPEDDAGHSEI